MQVDLIVTLLTFILGLLLSYIATFLMGVSTGGDTFVGITILFLAAIIAGKQKNL